MRLNIGSGSVRYEGWMNLDARAEVNPDFVSDVLEMPFKDGTIDEIYASHILEHIKFGVDALKEWERVLKPGGRITICVPDIYQMLSQERAKICTKEYLHMSVFGQAIQGHDPAYHSHYRVYTPDILLEEMRERFRDVKVGNEGTPRPACFGEVVAQGYKI